MKIKPFGIEEREKYNGTLAMFVSLIYKTLRTDKRDDLWFMFKDMDFTEREIEWFKNQLPKNIRGNCRYSNREIGFERIFKIQLRPNVSETS